MKVRMQFCFLGFGEVPHNEFSSSPVFGDFTGFKDSKIVPRNFMIDHKKDPKLTTALTIHDLSSGIFFHVTKSKGFW